MPILLLKAAAILGQVVPRGGGAAEASHLAGDAAPDWPLLHQEITTKRIPFLHSTITPLGRLCRILLPAPEGSNLGDERLRGLKLLGRARKGPTRHYSTCREHSKLSQLWRSVFKYVYVLTKSCPASSEQAFTKMNCFIELWTQMQTYTYIYIYVYTHIHNTHAARPHQNQQADFDNPCRFHLAHFLPRSKLMLASAFACSGDGRHVSSG